MIIELNAKADKGYEGNNDEHEHHHHGEGCGCGDESEYDEKIILIEFLFLDLDNCKRCIETKNTLFAAIDDLKVPLEAAGYTFDVQGFKISTEELAREFEIVATPTILVNYQDILGKITENVCVSCSDICGNETTCRTYTYQGNSYDVPPKGMIIEGVLQALYNSKPVIDNMNYKIPENIMTFIKNQKV
ncbi:MAG: DUF2703 domain-containing protein [Clostridiales bacterium]|nr:DUF2703 domain-containing protein [Clostridiales bacterium]